jgi:aryl-alcohol dehydrogenase-like predicted oxidoreductase
MFPIPGTKKVKNLKEIVGAVNVKLSIEELRVIREALKEFPVYGDRYNPTQLAMVDR